jgi:hypothetical protein
LSEAPYELGIYEELCISRGGRSGLER